MSMAGKFSRVKTPWIIVPVLLAIGTVLCWFWFITNFEKKEYEAYQDIFPAARKNPLLAADKFLSRAGHNTTSLNDISLFTNLPSPDDAMVVLHMPSGLSKPIRDRILNWVKAGGHLLMSPNSTYSDHPGNEHILEYLGVKPEEYESDSDCGCPTSTEEEKDEQAESGTVLDKTDYSLDPDQSESDLLGEAEEEDNDDTYHPYDRMAHLEIGGFPVSLQYFHPTLLEDTKSTATFRIEGSYRIEYQEDEGKKRDDNFEEIEEENAWLLQYTLGAGTITVLSEMDLFYNDSIGEYDHAFFLSWLTKNSSKIWLLYASNSDSLLAITWKIMPQFWISFFVFLLLILWRFQKQSGILTPLQTFNRHNIIAHIDASGHYGWRTDKLTSCVESNRKVTLQWLASRKLGLRPDQDIKDIDLAKLATKAGITERQQRDTFQLEITNEQDLIKTTRALQQTQMLIQGGDSARHDRQST